MEGFSQAFAFSLFELKVCKLPFSYKAVVYGSAADAVVVTACNVRGRRWSAALQQMRRYTVSGDGHLRQGRRPPHTGSPEYPVPVCRGSAAGPDGSGPLTAAVTTCAVRRFGRLCRVAGESGVTLCGVRG